MKNYGIFRSRHRSDTLIIISMHRTTNLLLVLLLLVSCSPAKPTPLLIVITHPDGPLFVGDQVSFEVLAPTLGGGNATGVTVSINGQDLGGAGFAPYGLGGRQEATLWWVWNTKGLVAGDFTLTFTLQPENNSETVIIKLHPAGQVPAPEPTAAWATTTTVCCTIYYITGTAAERDLSTLSQEADQQSEAVAAQMGTTLPSRIDLVLMPRVVGQGGFTWGGIYISYLDRNYLGSDMPILFHHEFVHYYDALLGGSYLPSMLQEGLAVYLTGGHFKPEPLLPRAAALFDLDWYIPLTKLADDFYHQQHDIGYLEAGALVEYLVQTYGWKAFNQFYRAIPAPKDQTDSSVIDSSLKATLGITFEDLETGLLKTLRSQAVSDQVRTDLRVAVDFFNTARRYQAALDPSAYFLTAWLPNGADMRQRGIVADLLRHPDSWKNRMVESLLIRSYGELINGSYQSASTTLEWTNWVLDFIRH